ncbi:putative lipase [Lysobacter capsici]|jgi:hypothetical protein|uniref:X-Tfes XVIPCD domain-containing protein n=1 Tax=Lysobacter capsici AZ78 TaxID=1444315 RepID=A0A108UAH3_9GAMM|nr:XVIPCD domain-containing protein [Lysobacter capsici]ALN88866.1 putative lipase [Lysobacter capsici]KWS05563.1 hypothetical protein AZ78_3115 [Lysobacter capsici AZ78]
MPSSQDYAALSQDAYNDRRADPTVSVPINGVDYRVLATANNRENGYQGTIYQRVDSGEIIVAHRGTEPTNGVGEFIRDVIRTDGGMVVNGVNNQAPDAIALTQRAIDIAREQGERTGRPQPPVAVTGHSLGGTLAQISAHRFQAEGVHGETFNAYGAAGLNMGIPAGDNNRMINHVRASDTVSSASPQYGQTRVYATQEDVDALRDAGYANNRRQSFWPDFIGGDLRNPVGVVASRGLAAHDIAPFAGGPGTPPLMTRANEDRAQQFDPMIDKFRGDIGAARAGITGASQNVQDGIRRVREGWNDLFSHNGHVQGAPLVSDSPLLGQTYAAIDRGGPALAGLDHRAVASLTATAGAQGLHEIHHVARGNNGTLFAVQGQSPNDPAALRASVDLETQRQPLAVSSQQSVQQAEQAQRNNGAQQEAVEQTRRNPSMV